MNETRSNHCPADRAERMNRVRLSLDGLSLGDSFGERFVVRQSWTTALHSRQLPPPPWKYTDDTEMALAIAEVLNKHGCIEQDDLAVQFADRYATNPYRGYGAGVHELLSSIARGISWQQAASALFDGQGSYGNGAAMRVASIGAYFANDSYETVAMQARLSAEVTHQHAEGIAGAVAVAIAAAWASRSTRTAGKRDPQDLFNTILEHTPTSETRAGIARAAQLKPDTWQYHAAEQLGNGSRVTAPDTVPFCLWLVARHLDDFTEAMWSAVHVGGDIDTNCAIVGGLLSLAVGADGLPSFWLKQREPLPH